MADLPEKPLFEPIFQLENDTPAEAMTSEGEPSYANIQAAQLANRTRYLKEQLDAYNSLIKSGELPFSSATDAQNAINAGKIPLGALFSVRIDDEKVWAAEYKNLNGEATATGKMISSTAALEPTFYITEADPDGTLAGLSETADGQTFKVAQGTDSDAAFIYYLNDKGIAKPVSAPAGRAAVEAVSAQFTNTFNTDIGDDGLTIVDVNGFIGQVMNPRTGVVGGSRARIDPLSFVNESFSLIADESTASLHIDRNGFIGFEVGLDGKIRGGSSAVTVRAIDTAPAILEASALVQWNVLKDSSTLKSRISTEKLTAQTITPVYRDYGAQLAAWTGALITPLADRNLYTACFTVQVPALTNTSDRVAIYSTISASTTGGGTKLIFAMDANGNIYVIDQTSNCWTTALNLPAGIKSGDWIQIIHVMSMDNSGPSNYHAIAFGGLAQQIMREADTSPKNLSSYKFALGNAWINSAAYKNVGIIVYEMVIYNHALTDQELSIHFNNACVRASADGIQIVRGAA